MKKDTKILLSAVLVVFVIVVVSAAAFVNQKGLFGLFGTRVAADLVFPVSGGDVVFVTHDQSGRYRVDAHVHNSGNLRIVQPFGVSFQVGQQTEYVAINSMLANEIKTASVYFDASFGAGANLLIIKADYANRIREKSESNNEVQIEVLVDENGEVVSVARYSGSRRQDYLIETPVFAVDRGRIIFGEGIYVRNNSSESRICDVYSIDIKNADTGARLIGNILPQCSSTDWGIGGRLLFFDGDLFTVNLRGVDSVRIELFARSKSASVMDRTVRVEL